MVRSPAKTLEQTSYMRVDDMDLLLLQPKFAAVF